MFQGYGEYDLDKYFAYRIVRNENQNKHISINNNSSNNDRSSNNDIHIHQSITNERINGFCLPKFLWGSLGNGPNDDDTRMMWKMDDMRIHEGGWCILY